MSISVFDLFKIGIGPSSSHTMGPWKACRRFVQSLEQSGQLRDLDGVQVVLYGSLAKTGRGHGTAKALQLGLMDTDPEQIEPRAIPDLIAEVGRTGRLEVGGRHGVPYYGFLGVAWPGNERRTLQPGEPVTLRYRVWIHRGDAEEGRTANAYAAFANP